MAAASSRRTAFAVLFFGVFLPASGLHSASLGPDLLSRRWRAFWITCPDVLPREFGVCEFRKTFSVNSAPHHFVIHVSADNRYELYVNGVRTLEGPDRGDLDHWRFETLDIAPLLGAGRNTLAAVVWNFAEAAPMAQITHETGFILEGEAGAGAAVNTDSTWKSWPDPSRRMIPADQQPVRGYFVVGPGERVDGTRYPWGWQETDFDDSSWRPARRISIGGPRGIQDSPSRWMLVPDQLPQQEERLQRLSRIVRQSGAGAGEAFLGGTAPLTIPANSHATILCDQTFETTAYPELVTSGGRNAEITLTYAEALSGKNGEKGNRSEIRNKEMRGFHDVFLPDGGQHRLFRPLWWRTFRYIQVDVTTRSDPVILEDLRGLFTAYPFTERAAFTSDDPVLARIWDVGWRTARLCAHETYMDCPYYEQLQYAGDTRIQVLISLSMTGDDRLAKNAIELLGDSRTPDGLTQSRYPSRLPQYIPPFSLFWISIMHDVWWYRGDADFLRRFLPNARGVLEWFRQRLSPSGLLGRLDWWNFVDWAADFPDGVPPLESDGQSSILSLQFAIALREAADLESAFGIVPHAEYDRALAGRVAKAVYQTCWDAHRQLIADTPARRHFSQHANILAVLADAIPPDRQAAVMRTVLSDATLTPCSYYFRFYLFRAMKKAGLADAYLSRLGPWQHMLDLGLTTFAETPEPTRSDCHAWSAHPNFDLLATVAGIEPAAPGFARVNIEPHLGPLTYLAATLPHPRGEIAVRYRRSGAHLTAEVALPAGLSGRFVWRGKRAALRGGRQSLTF